MEKATQTRHPWRATVRTVLAALVGVVIILPEVVEAAGIGHIGWAAAAVAVAGAVTRVLAVPAVDAWLRQYLPWLAAEPPDGQQAR